MKKLMLLFLAVLVFCCKKKDKTEDPPPSVTTTTTTTTTTGGSTTGGSAPSYAAEFLAYNSIDAVLPTAIGTAKIYNSSGDLISLEYVKLDGSSMGQTFSNEYRYLSTTRTFTAPISWEISDYYNIFPDTLFMSKSFPALGYTTAVNTVYDKTKDFVIPVELSTCDSMIFTMGGVTKRIPGKSGINSITFKPSDNVARSTYDTTQVDITVQAYIYDIFTVRGKKWKSVTGASTASHYKYKN